MTRYSFRCFLGVRPPWNGSPSYFEWKDDCSGSVPFEAGLGWLYSRWCQHQMAAVAANFALFEWFCDPEMLCSRGFWSVVFSGASSFRWCMWVWLRMRILLALHKPAWPGVLYLRFWQVTCCSIEAMTIPRMELVAAVLAARVDVQLRSELDFTLGDSHFWSDSTSVLGYVKNERARFNIFVANRVAVIQENTTPAQWHYVPSRLNPADDASRGLDGEAILQCDRWKNGPRFLWNSEEEWPVQPDRYGVDDNDPEVKVTICASRRRKTCYIIPRILSFFSDWRRLLRFVALLKWAVRDFRRSSQDGSVQLDGVRDSQVCVKDLDD